MINLEFVSQCPSVLSSSSLNGRLNFCTDTRKYKNPSAFVAIPGAKVNPLDMIGDLLKTDCPLVVYQESAENKEKTKSLKSQFPKTEFVPVSDSVIFLQELSHLHILEWQKKSPKNKVFAISGSNGKTTHKEMLSHILKTVLSDEKIVATEKNNNNHLGVPLTLLVVNERTEIVVLELGSNHPGEIKVLCDIAHPNAGLTTNIGATHLEFFGSEEKVFHEEGYLYHALGENDFFLINTDDPFLRTLPKKKGSVLFGTTEKAEARITFTAQGAIINYQGKEFQAQNEFITGEHNKLNLITSLFIACHLHPELQDKFTDAASTFKPTKNRSEWIEFEGRPVYLDAYNANPSSMRASLHGFKESVREKGFGLSESCVVLGDMNELGDETPRYHRELGEYIGSLGFPNVHFVGRFAKHYREGFSAGKAHASSAEFKNEYRTEVLKKCAIHFIKGSRSLQLESLFDIT